MHAVTAVVHRGGHLTSAFMRSLAGWGKRLSGAPSDQARVVPNVLRSIAFAARVIPRESILS